MTTATPVMMETDLDLEVLHRAKVRDIYALGDDRLLLVATDRVSAFDVVLPNGVPRKGEVLTRTSEFWFSRTSEVVPNAFIAVLDASNAAEFGVDCGPEYYGRSMVMHRAEVLKVEAVVRGYIAGSGWAEYQQSGTVCGNELPAGLLKASQLLEPIFTPSTKADPPEHDAPMTYEETEALLGPEVANTIKLRALALYRYGAHHAAQQGILVADTKFEFGMVNGEVTLIDEVMTPDSSRFWPADKYFPGVDQPSFDKQPLRDYLDGLDWDKTAPGPVLPDAIVDATSVRYLEAYRLITGADLPA
jgi:phosphoribosylaminoimidazole-succinocarboxamide synthase